MNYIILILLSAFAVKCGQKLSSDDSTTTTVKTYSLELTGEKDQFLQTSKDLITILDDETRPEFTICYWANPSNFGYIYGVGRFTCGYATYYGFDGLRNVHQSIYKFDSDEGATVAREISFGQWEFICDQFKIHAVSGYSLASYLVNADSVSTVVATTGAKQCEFQEGEKILFGDNDLAGEAAAEGFVGYLGNIAIWNKLLEEAEMIELRGMSANYSSNTYRSNFGNYTSSVFLRGWWRMGYFDRVMDSTVPDISGRGVGLEMFKVNERNYSTESDLVFTEL